MVTKIKLMDIETFQNKNRVRHLKLLIFSQLFFKARCISVMFRNRIIEVSLTSITSLLSSCFDNHCCTGNSVVIKFDVSN